MGNEIIDLIIQSAREMRSHGNDDPLIAIVGEGVELDGLCAVNTTFGEVLVYQHFDLAAPNTIKVVTKQTYQELIAAS